MSRPRHVQAVLDAAVAFADHDGDGMVDVIQRLLDAIAEYKRRTMPAACEPAEKCKED